MNQLIETKAQLINLLEQHKASILRYGVSRIGVFGSFVRDESTLDSDVDFLVEFRAGMKSYDNYIELAYFLEDLLGRKIELLTPQSLSPYIGEHILKEVEYVVAA